MKPIGVLTFASNNYGACLQAFSIIQAIKAITKAEVHFINYNCPANSSEGSSKKRNPLTLLSGLFRVNIYKYLKARPIFIKRNEKFNHFRKEYIIGDDIVYDNIDELKEISDKYSAIVCGSDMIWSSEFIDDLDIYMLSWCGRAKRISYAPSIGDIDIALTHKEKYLANLSKFDSISCREQNAVEFVKAISGIDAELVVDPTLLFDKKQWTEWFVNENDKAESQYNLVYCFGGITDSIRKQLNSIEKRQGIITRYILSDKLSDTVNELKFGDGAYGPAEYVNLFANANFVVVNGYHGLIFALIFEKPFVVLHRGEGEHWGKHEVRMTELLGRLNLKERYISRDAEIPSEFYTLDYSEIRDAISYMREESYAYLSNALES